MKNVDNDIQNLADENFEKMKRGESMRIYDKKIAHDDWENVYTLEQWIQIMQEGPMGNEDGDGYWVKEGFYCQDEVFSSIPEDATHVIWFAK